MRGAGAAAAAVALGASACTLEPLVDDSAGASVHILPPGAEVPRVDEDPELVHQITVHDGLEDGPLAEAMGVIARKTGWASGAAVTYWSFGPATKTGAPVYVLVDGSGVRIDHPYLFDTVPGDPGYSAIRRVIHVPITSDYHGERLTTLRALDDAIELGLVETPLPAGTWFDAPVVPPGTTLDVGLGKPPLAPVEVFAGGYRVDTFIFGGDRGVQPLRNGAVPSAQASMLREGSNVAFLAAPVFQLPVPAAPPTMTSNYTPLCIRVEVRLAPGVVAADTIHGDADLFTRSSNGAITATSDNVASFEVTERIENWPLQFVEGEH
jgi:subtilisin family serine protease